MGGVSENDYLTKKEILNLYPTTLETDKLSGYGDDDFVANKDVVKKSGTVVTPDPVIPTTYGTWRYHFSITNGGYGATKQSIQVYADNGCTVDNFENSGGGEINASGTITSSFGFQVKVNTSIGQIRLTCSHNDPNVTIFDPIPTMDYSEYAITCSFTHDYVDVEENFKITI